MNTKELQSAFFRAHIPLRLGIWSRNENAFFMTVQRFKVRKNEKKPEIILLCPGASTNDVNVIDGNCQLRQVVLRVWEPQRIFWDQRFNSTTGKMEMIQRVTPDIIRFYLVGMDQCHLFIAQLPRAVSSVKRAHSALKPEIVKNRGTSARIKRQGEWFFIPASKIELKLINKAIKTQSVTVRSSTMQRHVVSMMVNVANITFVSGEITHPEHLTLKLHGWYRVARNTEIGSANWVD